VNIMLTLSHDKSLSIKNTAEWPPLCHLQTTTKKLTHDPHYCQVWTALPTTSHIWHYHI